MQKVLCSYQVGVPGFRDGNERGASSRERRPLDCATLTCQTRTLHNIFRLQTFLDSFRFRIFSKMASEADLVSSKPCYGTMTDAPRQKLRWQDELDPSLTFDQADSKALQYIPPEPNDRKFACARSEKIVFQDKDEKMIWATKGKGQMILPAQTAVWIMNGTAKCFILDG